MTTFACIGDIHFRLDRLQVVVDWIKPRRPDAVLLTGDFARGPFNLGDEGGPDSAFLDALRIVRTLDAPARFVPGNHDSPHLDAPENLDRRTDQIGDVALFGIGGAGPSRFGFPYEWDEDEISGLEVPACDVLLTHAPPEKTELDQLTNGGHVGSRAIRRLAERSSGALVCGHIHEAVGYQMLGNCLCYNAGSLGAPHGRTQVGLLHRVEGTWRVEHHVLD